MIRYKELLKHHTNSTIMKIASCLAAVFKVIGYVICVGRRNSSSSKGHAHSLKFLWCFLDAHFTLI